MSYACYKLMKLIVHHKSKQRKSVKNVTFFFLSFSLQYAITYSSILAGEYIIASEDSSFVLIFSDIALLVRGSTI